MIRVTDCQKVKCNFADIVGSRCISELQRYEGFDGTVSLCVKHVITSAVYDDALTWSSRDWV